MSSLTYLLKKTPTPFPQSGDEHKLMHAFRPALTGESNLEAFTWMKDLIKKYNSLNKAIIDSKQYDILLGYQNCLIKWAYYQDLIASPSVDKKPIQDGDLLTHQTKIDARSVVELTEGRDPNIQLGKMLSNGTSSSSRLSLIKNNIIDININPINIHALYRQVPFVGLFMYEYNANSLLIKNLEGVERVKDITDKGSSMWRDDPINKPLTKLCLTDGLQDLEKEAAKGSFTHSKELRAQLLLAGEEDGSGAGKEKFPADIKVGDVKYHELPFLGRDGTAPPRAAEAKENHKDESKDRLNTEMVQNALFLDQLYMVSAKNIREQIEHVSQDSEAIIKSSALLSHIIGSK